MSVYWRSWFWYFAVYSESPCLSCVTSKIMYRFCYAPPTFFCYASGSVNNEFFKIVDKARTGDWPVLYRKIQHWKSRCSDTISTVVTFSMARSGIYGRWSIVFMFHIWYIGMMTVKYMDFLDCDILKLFQNIMKDKWMNMGYEEEELKPYLEPEPDYKDQKRIGRLYFCWFPLICMKC